MSIKKLAAIIFAAVIMMAGAMGISMKLIQQKELEMDVADMPEKTGESHILGGAEDIPLYYDDEKKLMLPLRNTLEGLGGSVEWTRDSRRAAVSCFGRTLELFPGRADGRLNGYGITFREPAEMINGRLYIDSGWLTDYFNVDVIWNNESRQVTLKTGSMAIPAAAACREEGRKGGRAYDMDIPVIIGLNDANFEKSLNETLSREMRALGREYLDAPGETEGTLCLRAETGFLTQDFISLHWEGEKDGAALHYAENIDLKGQKAAALSDLLTAGSLKDVEAALGEKWQDGAFYLSDTEGLVLLTEGENGGMQAQAWPEQDSLRWKEGFRELAG